LVRHLRVIWIAVCVIDKAVVVSIAAIPTVAVLIDSVAQRVGSLRIPLGIMVIAIESDRDAVPVVVGHRCDDLL
jgi:hypothetical protein